MNVNMVEFLEEINVSHFGGYEFLKDTATTGCFFGKLLSAFVALWCRSG